MLLPSEEEGVLARLKPKNIPIKKLTINPDKVGGLMFICLLRQAYLSSMHSLLCYLSGV